MVCQGQAEELKWPAQSPDLRMNWKPDCSPAPNTLFRLAGNEGGFLLCSRRLAPKFVLTMAKICTISDESDTSGDQEDTEHLQAKQGGEASHSEHYLADTQTSRGEVTARCRNFSINEEDFQEASDGKSGDGDPFRPRSRSAPPVLWAAMKYGRELRKMSDEFDTLLDKGMKRVRSAGTARQMHTSPSWFNFLWSHQESDTETVSSLTAQNTRPAE
ncbi:hypothetical protein PDJAM_G00200830 [Pangasius djambal]|uniref:Uncharacterized protein n=1 Tax=Pangasius djambal TaxID=1691987 RepID=A0ACC5Y7J1_9TELE|nr:hypothetical protein [Pangasius djambal]